MPSPTTVSLTSAGGKSARADQEQYYLLFMLPTILKNLQEKINRNEAPPKSGAATIKQHFDRWNFRFIMAKPSKGFGNSSMFRLFSNTKDLPILNKIPPSILSAIVPQVKIFKLFYKGENKIDFAFNLPFDTHTEEQSIQNIIDAQKGNMTNVNIESFNYSFIGTNPAESENCLTATLVLKFQSIDALLAEFLIRQNADGSLTIQPPSFSSAIRATPEEGIKTFRYSDLINQEKKFQNDGSFNSKYYRIKAQVKYQVDRQIIKNINDSFFNTDEKIDKLFNALNDTQHSLFLYHIGHDLRFEQDGRISLTINYRGAIEDILLDNGADLFLATQKGQKLAAAIKTEEQEKIKNLQRIRSSNLDPIKKCINSESENYKTDLEKEEKRQSEQQKLIDRQRGALQSEILADLFGLGYNTVGLLSFPVDKDNSIFQVDVTDQTLISRDAGDTNTDNQIDDPSWLAGQRQYGGRQGLEATKKNLNLSWIDQTYVDALAKGSINNTFNGNINNDASVENMITVSDSEKVQFIFLGDLIYTALNSLQNIGVKFPTKQDPNTKAFTDAYYGDAPRFVFGTVSLLYPESYGQILTTAAAANSFLETETITVGTRKYSSLNVNLAYLPISINFFNKWYLNTVIKQKKTKYPLQVFLNEFIELIRTCTMYVFENSIGSVLNSRLLGLGVSVDQNLIDQIPLVGTVDFDAQVDANQYFLTPRGGTSALNDASIYIYYVQSLPMPSIRAANVGDNEARGIFTFTIGSNAGLVKDISFQKQNIPFMQEARMTQEGELRRGVLRMKYNATITMYGSSLYRPGDVLIINPVFLTRFGLGEVQSVVLDELGLGGIYVVTKTETDIALGTHITKLNCVFMAYGNGSMPMPEGAVDLANCPPAG